MQTSRGSLVNAFASNIKLQASTCTLKYENVSTSGHNDFMLTSIFYEATLFFLFLFACVKYQIKYYNHVGMFKNDGGQDDGALVCCSS